MIMIILSSLLCYLSCDQTLDCVESEWTEIKLFERFFRTIRATGGNLFSNCPARRWTGNSRRVDFASCNPCQVHCKPWACGNDLARPEICAEI